MTKQFHALWSLRLAGSPATWLRTQCLSEPAQEIVSLSVGDIYRRISLDTKIRSTGWVGKNILEEADGWDEFHCRQFKLTAMKEKWKMALAKMDVG